MSATDMEATGAAPVRGRVLMQGYLVWLAAVFVIQLLGYADTHARRDLLTILAELAVVGLAVAVWRLRVPVSSAFERLRVGGLARFVLAGLVAAYVSETFYYFASSSPLPLPVFWLRTLVWYAGWYAAWWWLLSRVRFSALELFLLAGVNGWVIEAVFLGQVPALSPVGLLLYPLAATLYGALLLVPVLLREPDAAPAAVPPSRARAYALGLLPLLAFVPGLAWTALVQWLFGVSG